MFTLFVREDTMGRALPCVDGALVMVSASADASPLMLFGARLASATLSGNFALTTWLLADPFLPLLGSTSPWAVPCPMKLAHHSFVLWPWSSAALWVTLSHIRSLTNL